MNPYLPMTSALVALIMGLLVMDQFFAYRKPYQLVWGLSLLVYFVGAGCEFLAGKYGVSLGLFRTWYLFGVFYGGVYLGVGMLYLLMPRRIVHVILGVVLAVSAFAAYMVFSAKLDIHAIHALSGSFMPSNVRNLTPAFNGFGVLALVGGGLYSLWVYIRRRTMGRRALSNAVIAVASILPAIGGIAMESGASPDVFYALELLAIIVFSVGFLISREVFVSYRVPFIHGWRRAR